MIKESKFDSKMEIYGSYELNEFLTSKNFLLVQSEGNRQVKRNIPMTMETLATRIDKFLLSDDRDILKDVGKISHEIACDNGDKNE